MVVTIRRAGGRLRWTGGFPWHPRSP